VNKRIKAKKETGNAEDEKFMRLAIAQARRGIACGEGPFGCVIVRKNKVKNEVVARAYNSVVCDDDATAHAEVKAIRAAGAALGTPFLCDCVLYSTCEPCPMCFSACWWARVARVVYGSEIATAAAAGLNELRVSVDALNRAGGGKISLRGGVLRGECAALFKEWKAAGGKKY